MTFSAIEKIKVYSFSNLSLFFVLLSFFLVPVFSTEAEAPLAEKTVLTKSLFSLGKKTYEKQCSVCHGMTGAGDGVGASLLYPKPRDFTRGEFRLVSTSSMQATDEDLFKTITRGMTGSSMPPWETLPAESRWALVYYVRYLYGVKDVQAKGGVTQDQVQKGLPWDQIKKLSQASIDPEAIIQVPEEPATSPESVARGRELFTKACAPCHGLQGKGDGQMKMSDNLGIPLRPRDLTAGVFKGEFTSEALYHRLTAGLPGSPMPSYKDALQPEQLWDLIHYVQTLSDPAQVEAARLKSHLLTAKKSPERLMLDPSAKGWDSQPAAKIVLTPLWWRNERVESVEVKALHDGENLEILLSWEDAVRDQAALSPQSFSDGVAVEISEEKDPPFFGMGSAGHPVTVWHWKAAWQDSSAEWKDIEHQYPNTAVDRYESQKNYEYGSPFEMNQSATKFHDPQFLTGWGAGNPLSDPEQKKSAEEARSGGLGSYTSSEMQAEEVEAKGVWKEGKWAVVFHRPLQVKDKDRILLKPGKRVSIAFAVWDGAYQDRNGQKMVSIWNELQLEE